MRKAPNLQTLLHATAIEADVMERSEQFGALAAALAKAQGEIEGAVKGRENTFFKTKYADLAAAMAVCRGPLSKNGIAIIQSTQFTDSNRWIETFLVHSSGEWVSSIYPVKPVKDDPQGLGSAVTYARRYALMAIVGIVVEDDADDDDGNKASDRPLPQSSPYSANPSPRNSNGNGNGDSKAPAVKWCKDAVDTIRSFKDMADLSAWEARNEKAIQRLSEADSRLHDELLGAMADKYAVLSPLNAG